MSSRTGRFGRSDRLRISRDFKRVGSKGRRVRGSTFVVLMASSRRPLAMEAMGASLWQGVRLGITVSRRVGNAVARNRVKRAVREWFRQYRSQLSPCDLVIIGRPGAAERSSKEISQLLCEQLDLVRPGYGGGPPRGLEGE